MYPDMIIGVTVMTAILVWAIIQGKKAQKLLDNGIPVMARVMFVKQVATVDNGSPRLKIRLHYTTQAGESMDVTFKEGVS